MLSAIGIAENLTAVILDILGDHSDAPRRSTHWRALVGNGLASGLACYWRERPTSCRPRAPVNPASSVYYSASRYILH